MPVEELPLNIRAHWEDLYTRTAQESVSWYRPHLETSLRLIEKSIADRDASIIDAGGGSATLVDDLIARGYRDITVLDLSETALKKAKLRLGAASEKVTWIVSDITRATLPERRYDLWHDRAVFHFLTHPSSRIAYVSQVARAIKPGGHLVIATFGPEGPMKCSGLPVVRYDAEALLKEFGSRFRLTESITEMHRTPSGNEQQFLYCRFKII